MQYNGNMFVSFLLFYVPLGTKCKPTHTLQNISRFEPTSIVIFIAFIHDQLNTLLQLHEIAFRLTSGKLNGAIVNVNNLLAILMNCPVQPKVYMHNSAPLFSVTGRFRMSS